MAETTLMRSHTSETGLFQDSRPQGARASRGGAWHVDEGCCLEERRKSSTQQRRGWPSNSGVVRLRRGCRLFVFYDEVRKFAPVDSLRITKFQTDAARARGNLDSLIDLQDFIG